MAVESEPRNAGRRIITQEEAEAIAAKARPDQPPPVRKSRIKLTRREALAYALVGSTALTLATAGAGLVQPDPSTDPFLSSFTPEVIQENVPGGFAYPRFKEGEFGGTFTLARKVEDYTPDDPPYLNPNDKFYIVKVDLPVEIDVVVFAQLSIMTIYKMCMHLGCLIVF